MIEEVTSCDLDRTWVWEHGHVNKRKFRGRCLSLVSARRLDADLTEEDVLKSKVVHGWTVTVDGGDGYCGGIDMMQYLLTKKPRGEKTYLGRAIVDGPHEATYLEVDL